MAKNGETAELHFPIIEKQLLVGRILYADYKLNEAVEVDMNGNSAAIRLPNGDTLVNSRTEIQLISPEQEIRWKIVGLKHSVGLSVY